MKIPIIAALALLSAAPAFAGDATPGTPSRPLPLIQPPSQSRPQQEPATEMKTLLQELRELDSSQDKQGDHVVGELLC